MKKILSLLIMSLFAISLVGVVSAQSGDIEITIYMEGDIVSPEPGYIGGEVSISWVNVEDAYLKYQEGLCDGLSGGTVLTEIHSEEDGSYEWNTTIVEDGEYCIKLTWGDVLNNVSVIVDNTAPEIEFIGAPYFTEADHTLYITGNIIDKEDIAWYNIDFGDGTPSSSVRIWEEKTSLEFNKSHIYAEEQKYTIEIYARDEAGNVNSASTIVVVNMESPDWIIPLSTDTPNLISIPLEPEDTDYKEVLADVKTNLDRIWAYTYDENSRENKWEYRKTTSTGDWSTLGSLSDIVPGYGYFIFMKSDDVLYGKERTMSADPNIPPVTPSAVKLANGYNLIGLFGTTPKPVWDALSSLINLEGYAYWHKVLDINQNDVTSEDMEVGKGYWVSMLHMPDSATEDYYTYYP